VLYPGEKKNMQTLPIAIANLWAAIVNYPFAIIGTVLFAIALHRLANRYRCYGLSRNLLFEVISGVLAFALFQLYIFLSRNYGLRSVILAELIVGYETAVLVTVIRRLVFAQRPPQTSPPVDGGSA